VSYQNPWRPSGTDRRRRQQSYPVARGLFAGNKSVKYGMVAVLACMLVAGYINRGDKVLTGPIDDVFRRDPSSLLIVYGTEGDNPEGIREYAHKVGRLLGVSMDRDILVYPDREVDSGLIRDSSLLLYGTVEGNRISRKLSEHFPFQFGGDTLGVDGQTVATHGWQLVFAVPNPHNDQRYLLLYTGPSDSAVIGMNMIEHPNFVRHDTTDFVLAVNGRIERSGFFLKDIPGRWKLPR
jgi:hypothetical protein